MRLIAVVALIATMATITGCQIVPYSDNRFALANEAEITPHQVRFPIILTYPDMTDYFYPIYDKPPRSDLNLRAIDCQIRSDGTLTVVSLVQNMGSDIIASMPTSYGSQFRVVATVSTASGGKERVEAVQLAPLTVPTSVFLASNATRALASEITAIDVVADPDRYVPDPVRDNNRLSWRGSIDPANPRCSVSRY
jgi:hypothetical protein